MLADYFGGLMIGLVCVVAILLLVLRIGRLKWAQGIINRDDYRRLEMVILLVALLIIPSWIWVLLNALMGASS